MGTKTVKYNKEGISLLPKDKPVLYRILTEAGTLNYAGVSQRGQVQERIKQHLDNIPGTKVQIEQFHSINDAKKKEANVIKKNQPKYNEKDK